jgi:SAM-dependent methyltransferase
MPMQERDDWNSVVAEWVETPKNAFLRAYSDAVNRSLIARWLPDLRGARVLKTDAFDEAVGDGLYPTLAAAGARVTCIDLSRTAVAAATTRHPELQAEVGDVRQLELADGTFDVVVSNSTLDHFASRAEVRTALQELYRVLKPGGTLLVTLDNPVNPLVALRNALPARLLNRVGLVAYPLGTTCGPNRLASLLRDVGFRRDASGAVMHVPRVLAQPVASLARRGRTIPFLMSFEQLDRWPLRYLTGQFVAARAIKPSA